MNYGKDASQVLGCDDGMTHYIHSYTVTGSGAFPSDMLRYDQAWPMDSEGVRTDYKGERRAVRVKGLNPPTEGRWTSFGWKVTDIGTKYKLN